ncbi:MAG: cyclic nucleotide-binding domain-containing protein [Deltaproteobacteria bacterium]|nr:cyclic nucleotide-binding domain-containing protein [Deltaproteobacteria bacterium]
MSTDTTPASLQRIPLFADFDENTLRDYLQLLQPVSFLQGDCLMTQGDVAESVFFLETGEVEVVTTLPGGSEVIISTLSPGSVIGEMALLDDVSTRTATVRALTPTTGFLIERQDCRTLLTQTQEMTFSLQRRITLSLCQRLRELFSKIVNLATPYAPRAFGDPEELGLSSHTTRVPASPLAYRAFLPQLPFFSRFRPEEVDTLLAQATVLELPRQHILFRHGNPGQSCFIIIRGAVELLSGTTRHYPLHVLGPGHICGQLALIEDAPHEAVAVTRSHTTLLELQKPSFDHFFTATTRTATKFQRAILQGLLANFARANNHLVRALSQSALRDRRKKDHT